MKIHLMMSRTSRTKVFRLPSMNWNGLSIRSILFQLLSAA